MQVSSLEGKEMHSCTKGVYHLDNCFLHEVKFVTTIVVVNRDEGRGSCCVTAIKSPKERKRALETTLPEETSGRVVVFVVFVVKMSFCFLRLISVYSLVYQI